MDCAASTSPVLCEHGRKVRCREIFLEQLEKEVTCGICQEYYTDPKILPCLHYYCKQCVLKLALRTGIDEPFHCPECRCKVTLPEEGVEGLKSSFFVGRLKPIWEGLVSVRDSKEEGKAEAIVEADGAESEMCRVHNEELKLYCFCCDIPICRDCTIVDHKEHTFQFNVVAASEMRRRIIKELNPLKEVGDELLKALEEVKNTREGVEAQGVGVAQTINSSFDELAEIVERRRKELLEQAGRQVQEKVDKLTGQESTLSAANAEVQSVVDYTERSVAHKTDYEFMSTLSEISNQIKSIHERNSSLQNIVPQEDVDVGVEVKCCDKVRQICQEEAKLTQLPMDITKRTVVGEGIRRATVDQAAEFTVIAKTLINGKPARHRNTEIVCVIKSLCNNHELECDVDQASESGCYKVSYTPTYCGRHKLTVLVDRRQIPNSPFSVNVDISPPQLGKPVRILYDVALTSDVTVNSSGLTVVGKQLEHPIVFYKDEQLVRSVSRNHLKLDNYSVVGIDIDSDDYIYFTVYHVNVLVKLDGEGKLVLKARSKGIGNLGLAVVGEEVAVCPRNHKGKIMLYDKNLKFKRVITGRGMGEFRDVSPDSENNLFVTDWDKNYVRVFSIQGSTLRSFNILPGSNALSAKLRGICVSGQYVYVCIEGGAVFYNGVYVFTTEGNPVSTIGCGGRNPMSTIGYREREEGQLMKPCGVFVDQDGFVHVADCTRLLVFQKLRD